MHKWHVPGLALAVVRNGKVVRAQGYGYANLELGVPVTPNTVFSLHSVSKQFCATGIMLLIREGKVHLDDPVTKYFPETAPAWSGITVKMLLNHTSGIPDYLNDNLKLDVPDNAPDSVIPGAVSKLPLKFTPGTKFAYSNTGFLMLAQIIHQITGRPDPEFLSNRIFKPLGMASSRTSSFSDIILNRAQRYDWKDGHFINGRSPSTVDEIGDGGMLSTVLDLAKWDAGLYTEKILTSDEKRLMWTPGPYDDEEKAHYGFGFYIDNPNGHRRVWHYGAGMSGQRSVIERYVDDKLTVIILVNGGEPLLPGLASQVAARYLKGGYHLNAFRRQR
jgi:CubicO group peptidase (beta-lactamase class C family)